MREALKGELAYGFEVESAVEHRHGLAAGENLAGLRFRAKASGEIRDVTDGSVVPATFEADRTERRIALRDADAEAEVEAAALLPVLGDRPEGVHRRECAANRMLRR